MSWAAVIVGAGTLIYKGVAGAKQKSEGKKLANQAFPEYQIPNEVTTAAAEGLPSEQYAQAMRNINRNQTAAIDSAQNRRSAVGMIAKTQQASNDATLNLDVANAKARQDNQKILAGYKDKQWQLNTKGKYDRDYNYGMNLIGAGNQNINSGVDDLISGVGSAAYRGAFNSSGNSGGYSAGANAYKMQRMAYNPDLLPYN